ncbi:hypothetical protein [Flavobacterium sp. LB2R40]|uniref:hypothetical protein n=1 Tax=Flavobacterium sp. LB2R40 TaxID=3401722 RepID=UPI003AAC868E
MSRKITLDLIAGALIAGFGVVPVTGLSVLQLQVKSSKKNATIGWNCFSLF